MRFFSVVIFLVAALRAEAAMVRVVGVVNGRTIAIERNGVRDEVKLAGVEVTNEAAARELLRWTATDTWVMLESSGNGEFLAYRSPDALFLNRELVLRGYARPTSAAIAPELRPPSRYLGEIDPMEGPKSSTPKVSAKARPQKSSGTGRRPPKARPRAPRSRAKE